MNKILAASAIALALVAGPMVNDAKAYESGEVTCGICLKRPETLLGPVVFGALVGGAIYLVATHGKYTKGELAAAGPDANMLQFQANAQRNTGTPAFAFIDTGASVASVK